MLRPLAHAPHDDSGPKIIGELARDRLGAVSAQAPAGFGVEIVGGFPHAPGADATAHQASQRMICRR
jgi:hypothetical protein